VLMEIQDVRFVKMDFFTIYISMTVYPVFHVLFVHLTFNAMNHIPVHHTTISIQQNVYSVQITVKNALIDTLASHAMKTQAYYHKLGDVYIQLKLLVFANFSSKTL